MMVKPGCCWPAPAGRGHPEIESGNIDPETEMTESSQLHLRETRRDGADHGDAQWGLRRGQLLIDSASI